MIWACLGDGDDGEGREAAIDKKTKRRQINKT